MTDQPATASVGSVVARFIRDFDLKAAQARAIAAIEERGLDPTEAEKDYLRIGVSSAVRDVFEGIGLAVEVQVDGC